MMMALGLRVPLSVKEHSPQVWLGKITGHHFWLSNHRLQHHDDTPLNQQGQRKADREKETEISPQTQSDSPDPLSLLLFYWSIIITIYFTIILLVVITLSFLLYRALKSVFFKRKMKIKYLEPKLPGILTPDSFL